MNAQQAIRLTFIFIAYILIQVLFLRKVILFDYAFCFIYIGAVLLIPNDFNTSLKLIISFVAGLTVDVFYNTHGLHAAATVAVAFVRNPLASTLFSARGLENEINYSLNGMGLGRFTRYVLIMVSIHHIALFSIEAGTKQLFWVTLLKIVFSVIFSTFIIVLAQFLQKNRD
jgi:hypothetical protein